MQTELEIVDMKNPVSWCFTPSQPVRLYQGDMKNPKSDKYCIYYFLQKCYGLKIYIQANIQEKSRLCFLFLTEHNFSLSHYLLFYAQTNHDSSRTLQVWIYSFMNCNYAGPFQLLVRGSLLVSLVVTRQNEMQLSLTWTLMLTFECNKNLQMQ